MGLYLEAAPAMSKVDMVYFGLVPVAFVSFAATLAYFSSR
jgi:hypothetical protein